MEKTTIEHYNSQNKRGRRKLTTEPLSERRAYMREQQRTFRLRKQKYLEDLKQRCENQDVEIKSLRAHLLRALSPSVPYCHSTGSSLLSEPMPPPETVLFDSSPETGSFSGSYNDGQTNIDFGDERNDSDDDERTNISETPQYPSAEQIFGPVQVNFFYNGLKHIPSLRNNSEVVDRLKNIFIKLTRATTTKSARRLLLHLLRAHDGLLKFCTVVECAQVIDLLAEFFSATTDHDFDVIKETEWPSRLRHYKAKLKAIPSLVEAGDAIVDPIIDTLCNFFAQPVQPSITVEQFFQLNGKLHDLMTLMRCTDDRRKLISTAEVVRQFSKKELEDFLVKIESLATNHD
ncbi:hypothetical protein HK100_004915 [Physocladia obscura]|uniref:BZIP domain-containing protein n=1 Tax=Physocladia obscura TaxID=109957 RepID=A0AAD5SSJ2_9FUNG|nr:hypothetical protein HK100_004915 [Physocladia obscura]